MLFGMAYTQSDLDALKEAIKTGELSVRYADSSVTYRTMGEMIQIMRLMEVDIRAAASVSPGPRYQLAVFHD